jgi:hypothetical protein
MKTTTTIKIKSVHANLASAVEASGMDLSYNPREAQINIAVIDLASRGEGYKSVAGLVAEDGRVFYVYGADIPLLNEFCPFFSVLSDSPLMLAYYSPANQEILVTNHGMDKSGEARKTLAKELKGKADLLGPLFTCSH